jgi:hypothetical protein
MYFFRHPKRVQFACCILAADMENEIVPLIDARPVITVLEEMQELLEVVSSEIPISDPKRQTIEAGLPHIRALISLCREEVSRFQTAQSPKQGNA